jgi:hypothetical protein
LHRLKNGTIISAIYPCVCGGGRDISWQGRGMLPPPPPPPRLGKDILRCRQENILTRKGKQNTAAGKGVRNVQCLHIPCVLLMHFIRDLMSKGSRKGGGGSLQVDRSRETRERWPLRLLKLR